MFMQVISHHPAPGKGPALIAAIEERTKAANAAGSPHAATQLMFPEEPTIDNAIQFESLDAFEHYVERRASDQAVMATLSKIADNLARPQTAKFYEVLVPAQPTGKANYLTHLTFRPAVGKGQELRQVLEERVRDRGTVAGSVGSALRVQFAAAEPNFTITVLYPSLAGLEEWRRGLPNDKGFSAFQAKLNGLLERNPSQALHRVLVPFNA